MRRRADTGQLKEMFRTAREQLCRLGMPERFTPDELHRAIERHRGRDIHLMPYPLPPEGPHGLWIGGRHADYIVYPADASPVRRVVVIAHEYGHMLAGDTSVSGDLAQLADEARPGSDPINRLVELARTSYGDLAERRAEVFGTAVVERVTAWSAPRRPADIEVLARMAAAMGPAR